MNFRSDLNPTARYNLSALLFCSLRKTRPAAIIVASRREKEEGFEWEDMLRSARVSQSAEGIIDCISEKGDAFLTAIDSSFYFVIIATVEIFQRLGSPTKNSDKWIRKQTHKFWLEKHKLGLGNLGDAVNLFNGVARTLLCGADFSRLFGAVVKMKHYSTLISLYNEINLGT